ncbi:myo-inositol 2-dehydrogenase [Sphingobacteriaceae bacterium]|nr:myo-inositol 2-dehydrogenase [Sphingobacteriaceae bacterium]
MSDNLNILLVGASQMAVDYHKVLKALKCEVTVVGRSKSGVEKFRELTGSEAIEGGLSDFLLHNDLKRFSSAIVAVGLEELFATTVALLKAGIKKILVEKPAGLNFEEIEKLSLSALEMKAEIYVAYNRRFYESVLQARKIIEEDGGVSSFHFEFTEWSHVIEKIDKKPGIKENWFLANSSHVVDLAFFMGGEPEKLSAYTSGSLSWHPVSIFAGSGITKKGALFTYHSNWEAPGRWFVELLTNKHRLILKPLEELHIQKRGSVLVEKMQLDSELDLNYKPGLFRQTQAFVHGSGSDLFSLQDHKMRLKYLKQIVNQID